MSININTAKALGLTIPPSLLRRADEVMDRRTYIAGAIAFSAVPLAAEAQPAAKVFRIDLLGGSPPTTPGASRLREGFFQGLRELGYVEGQNILVEGRWYGEQIERLPALAAELVRIKVGVIVAAAPPRPKRPSAPRQRSPSSWRIRTIR